MSSKKEKLVKQQTAYFDEEGRFYPRLVSSDGRKPVRLPALSARMLSFLERFQTSCTIDCCGFSALSFKPPS